MCLSDLENELMVIRREGWREGIIREFVHMAVCKMENQQSFPVQHMEFCSMLCGSLDGRGVWGRMDTCICMAESFSCPLGTITALLSGYTPI